ncbi:uncharacterized protein MELLADRAFT_93207 [Melampsora larici-populina 98AG31]|uniref:Uncharacterized protein n=1 Tax=Melampsora larici-populina (strain 98AG31 / pathotype 3-4-7) TaxID=747676 RepID=F4S475_MELLP|nr:uncharacterized protein MELLADRAFT_93207 [Melampsora larici-populina 98AG31]EGG00535.1 hypothetical protein MELLADRAFT_93207 [Melampsora larici-populina 98AG31]
MKWLNNNNFDAGLQKPESLPNSTSARLRLESKGDEEEGLEETNHENDPDAPIINRKFNAPPPLRIELIPLAEQLALTINDHHKTVMGKADCLRSSNYVDEDDIRRILDRIYTIETDKDVYNILGCDILAGGVAKLFNSIQEWKTGTIGSQAISQMRAREAATRLEQGRTLARLQKQQAERVERESKMKEARILTDQKRKKNKEDSLAEKEAKKQRKEQSNEKKKMAAKLKDEQETRRIVNARMIAGLSAGKTMREVEADEEMIRSQQSGLDNATQGS